MKIKGKKARVNNTKCLGGSISAPPPTYLSSLPRNYTKRERRGRVFYRGQSKRYNTAPGQTGTVKDGDHPFKSRIVVRRPKSTSKFNGAGRDRLAATGAQLRAADGGVREICFSFRAHFNFAVTKVC